MAKISGKGKPLKQTVKYQYKDYEIHGHADQLIGNDMVSDYISSYLANGHFYEEPLLSFLHKKYKTLGTVIDCGANIGNHAKFFTEVMDATVHAFEPNPENFRLLEKNNPKGTNYNVALGDKTGKCSIQSVPHNMGMSTVVKGTDIKVATIDSYHLKPELIKIDVEGMEPEVIKGAYRTIYTYRPILVVEHNDIQALYRTARVLEKIGYYLKVFPVETWEVFIYIPREQL